MRIKPHLALLFTCMLLPCLLTSRIVEASTEVSGTAAIEYRYFMQDPLFTQQDYSQLSFYLEPEIYRSWNNDLDSITFKVFYRKDQQDDERSHADIRELMWLHVGDDWELRTGIGYVYWGQTESLRVVDIINQTDSVEAIDGEDKLGQAMINLTLIRDWGNLDLFILPGFRERSFPGRKGRLRPGFVIEQNKALYESSAGKDHVDFASRWTHTLGDWEVGLSYFNGTSRDPSFVPSLVENETKLTPFYRQMQQVGLDMVVVKGDWLYKFEGVYRATNKEDNYFAMIAGFEYTTIGVLDSVWDIGWLMEYQFDDRDTLATKPGQNDLMLGSRLVFNDVNGTEILMGLVQDLDNSSTRTGFIEASSRINDNWKWRLETWLFSVADATDLTYDIRQDDYVQLNLEYYF